MRVKIINFLRQNQKQLIRYFLCGFSGFLLDIGLLWVLKQGLGLRPVWAVVFNQILILTYLFLVYKYFSFRGAGDTRRQLARFLIVLAGNYLFAVGWMFLGAEILGFNYLVVRIANIALSTTWNFFLYRGWVYREKCQISNDKCQS